MSVTAAVAGRNKFVLRDTSAEVVKSLSQNELALWMTMRRLADAKTGALRFQGKWIRAERIQREAKMGKTRRKETMKRLVGKGLVLMGQDHSVRDVADRLSGHVRKRFVFKEVQYWVSETPRQDWLSSAGHSNKPPKLRVSSAGRKEKKPSAGRFLSQHKKRPINSHNPPGASSSPHGGDRHLDERGEGSENHQGETDDLLRATSHLEKLKREAEEELMHGMPEGNRFSVRMAIETVAVHAHNSGVGPRSAKYFVVGARNLSDVELNVVRNWDPKSADAWIKNNALIVAAERTAKESGRDFFEVFRELRRKDCE